VGSLPLGDASGAWGADTRDSVCCSMENVANELPVAIDLTAGS
jgi:hypothetical protein